MLNGSENREIKCSNIVLVGVSYRLMWSTKVYVNREGETLKRWNVDGVVILNHVASIKGCSKKFQMSCVMLNAAGIAIDVLL